MKKLTTELFGRFNVLLGIWLFISPFVFGLYTPGAIGTVVYHSFFMGAALVVVAVTAHYHRYMWEEVINLLLGFWLILSPFVLGFSTDVMVMMNHIIIGVLVGIDAIVNILYSSRKTTHRLA